MNLGKKNARVLIYSPNLIGKSMAGAAIRSWEFAKTLSKDYEVILISPGKVDVGLEEFKIISLQDSECKKCFQSADVLITQRLTYTLARLTIPAKVRIIIDAYDPSPLELLELFKRKTLKERNLRNSFEVNNLLFSFKMADGILCASEMQRKLWIGFLLGQNLITPAIYDQDSSFRHFLTIVPFGLSLALPQKNGKGLKEKYGFSPTDKVILWGGGIWDWFDPLSLIEAMKVISETRNDIKLVFMGVVPPDSQLSNMSMSTSAMQLAKELGLWGQTVFFNQEWVPYEERQNNLLEADIGVSTHFDNLETEFSFRTRILDYLWAKLPILATTGDSFAELVENQQLGKIVPYKDISAIASSIQEIIDNPELIEQMKSNIEKIRERFYWPIVLTPLKKMIQRVITNPPRQPLKDYRTLYGYALKKIWKKGLKSCLKMLGIQLIHAFQKGCKKLKSKDV